MINKRPKLTVDEQIDHLKIKGIKFDHKYSEDGARKYLQENNNYFRLRAYRKNFTKIQLGDNRGKYYNLDFSHLVDLAIIDTRMRTVILEMCLNIEHFAKVNLLEIISNSNEDGYSIVNDYFEHLATISTANVDYEKKLKNEISRSRSSVYCGDIIAKYYNNYPVWAFVEIITFGSFIEFYKFCGIRLNNRQMLKEFNLLMETKSVRNAAAHNNCLINDFCQKDTQHPTQYEVKNKLGKIPLISRQTIQTKMVNPRIRQIVTLLYTHKLLVKSYGTDQHICSRLHEVGERAFRDFDYISNVTIQTTFRFLSNIIDNWYSNKV